MFLLGYFNAQAGRNGILAFVNMVDDRWYPRWQEDVILAEVKLV